MKALLAVVAVLAAVPAEARTDKIKVHGVSLEGNLEGNSPDRDVIVANRPTGGAGGPPGARSAPLREPLSRPLCPYPTYAKYDGSGDKSAAASFACVAPT